MPNLEGQRAYMMLDQPSEFLAHVLPQIQERTPRLQDLGDPTRTHDVLIHLQEDRWERETGVRATDSKFTVILPIYNEAKALPSTLSALMLSDIPQTVEAQFLFIVNASTDDSATIVKQHLSTISDVEEVPMKSETDPDVNKTAYRAKKGNVTYTLIETPTRTKANALNIGNEIALQTGHTIAMNIDLDHYVEPSSIPTLYKESHFSFSENTNIAAVDARLFSQHKHSSVFYKRHSIDVLDGATNDRNPSLFGAIFSWIPENVTKIGGFKPVLIDDYSFALELFAQHLHVHHADTQIWGYGRSTPIDILNERIRASIGFIQLKKMWEKNPEVISAMYSNDPIMAPLPFRLNFYKTKLEEFKRSPQRFIRFISGTMLRELTMIIGKIKYMLNPNMHIWTQAKSTK